MRSERPACEAKPDRAFGAGRPSPLLNSGLSHLPSCLTILLCLLGGLVLVGGLVAPLAGIILTAGQQAEGSPSSLVVPPATVLLARSVLLSAVATGGALLLGLWPAAVLASVRGGWRAVVTGLFLAGLLTPPQVYAYAWEVATGPRGPFEGLLPATTALGATGSVVRAGLISAGWLWPIVALIIATGWRYAGRPAYMLAILDTTSTRAFLRAALPSLRNYLAASACVVFAVTLIEYPIPHLAMARVWATELLLLVDAGAPAGQVIRMTGQVLALAVVLAGAAGWCAWSSRQWQSLGGDEGLAGGGGSPARGPGSGWIGCGVAAGVWLLTVGLPLVVLATSMRNRGAWGQALRLFAREWKVSLGVGLLAAVLTLSLAVFTVLLGKAACSRWATCGALLCVLVAVVPPAAVGVGFITVYNRHGLPGWLYDHTPLVWSLGLVARYAAVAVAVVWLAVGRQIVSTVEQARSDGAGSIGVLAYILLPMFAPALAAAGLIVAVLAMFEVVVTHLVSPVGSQGLSLTLLNHMHYGRDDVVIATSLTACGAGLVLTLLCGWLLVRPGGRRRMIGKAVSLCAGLVMTGVGGCGGHELEGRRPVLVFGEKGLGPGQFVYPRALATAPDGRLFVVDMFARIQRFNADGEYELAWRMPEWEAGKPTGISVDDRGRVLVADTHYHRVVIFDRNGKESARFGSYGEQLGQFTYPTSVAVDREGFLYVSEYGGNDRITRFTPDFEPIAAFGTADSGPAALSRPQSMTFDSDGSLWVADACHHRLCRFSREGRLLGTLGTAGRGPGQLQYPYDLAIAGDGTLLVCEYGNNRIQRFDRQGHSLGTWGTAGRRVGSLASPWGVALGADGRVYVLDAGNHRVQVLR
ncbi:MAG: hypothetical protein GXY55_09980 [Phycisphaerae bacterium]|nr:hypothetical protein [Phycisphaerae bacterium]